MRVAMLSVHTSPLARLGGWETGGMNVYVRELSRTLGQDGVDVDVFTRRQDPDTPTVTEMSPGARLIQLDAGPPRHIDKYAVLDYLPDLACNLQRFRNFSGRRYDVIHAHYWLSGRLGQLFRDRWHAPLVSTFHTLGSMKNSVAVDDAEREESARIEIERRVMASSDRVIASTEVDRDQLVKLYGMSRTNVAVIPPGVDLDHFRPGRKSAARKRLALVNEPTILFVGRIQRLKGLDVLIQAVRAIRDGTSGLKPQVLIVGGADESDQIDAERRELNRLRSMVRELDLESQVRFLGSAPNSALPSYYQAADLTVMPSSYESFGLVALESMACGTPVVASRVGGLTTLIRDGETGYLVNWRNPGLFAERIVEILQNPRLRLRMSRAARVRAELYGWQVASRKAEALYEHLALGQSALGPVAGS